MPSVILAGTTTGTALSLTSDTSGELQIKTNNGSTTALTLTTGGNLNIPTLGARILGDFSNATTVNRVSFQSSTTNGNTIINAIPNGTAVTTGFYAFTTGDPDNTSLFALLGTSTEGSLRAARTGTGTFLPMTMFTGGSERLRIDTSGNVGIGTSSSPFRLMVSGADNNGAFGLSGNMNANLPSTDGSSILAVGTNFGAGSAEVNYFHNNSTFVGTNGGHRFSQRTGASTYVDLFRTTQDLTQFYTGGTERMRIDSAGRVTMPSQPFFYARKSATPQTSVTGTTATFDTTVTNIGSHYNTSNNRFTAPISGVYSFTAKVWMSKNGGAYASLDPRINGTLIPSSAGAYYDGAILTTGNANYIVNFQYSLTAGDYVEFTYGCPGGGQTVAVDNSGYFCGFLLS